MDVKKRQEAGARFIGITLLSLMVIIGLLLLAGTV